VTVGRGTGVVDQVTRHRLARPSEDLADRRSVVIQASFASLSNGDDACLPIGAAFAEMYA
jgi:hypothetical protein